MTYTKPKTAGASCCRLASVTYVIHCPNLSIMPQPDIYSHRLCRSAWVGRSRPSVCLFVCLSAHTPNCYTLTLTLTLTLTYNLDLRPFNLKTISLLGYPKVIPYTKFENFGIIRFCCGQTDKQTDGRRDIIIWWSLCLNHFQFVETRVVLSVFLINDVTDFTDRFFWENILHIFFIPTTFTVKQFNRIFVFIRHQHFGSLVGKQMTSHCVYLWLWNIYYLLLKYDKIVIIQHSLKKWT